MDGVYRVKLEQLNKTYFVLLDEKMRSNHFDDHNNKHQYFVGLNRSKTFKNQFSNYNNSALKLEEIYPPPTGLWFCEHEQILDYLNMDTSQCIKWIGVAKLHQKSCLVSNGHHEKIPIYKTDKLDIVSIVEITEFFKKYGPSWEEIVNYNGKFLRFVPQEDQTNKLNEMAVQKYSGALKYVFNQTLKVCLIALRKNALGLEDIDNPTDEMIRIACCKNSYSIKFVPNPSIALRVVCVMKCGLALQYIEEQTYLVCILAMRQYYGAVEFVKFNILIKAIIDINNEEAQLLLCKFFECSDFKIFDNFINTLSIYEFYQFQVIIKDANDRNPDSQLDKKKDKLFNKK